MTGKKIVTNDLVFIKLQTISLITLILSLTFFNFSNYFSKNNKTYVLGVESNYEELISYWQNFLFKNPNYEPGWIRLAELEFERGNLIGAKAAFQKAFEVDPNSLELKSLKQKLGI